MNTGPILKIKHSQLAQDSIWFNTIYYNWHKIQFGLLQYIKVMKVGKYKATFGQCPKEGGFF